MEWLKEWALPLSAGATFLLALAAFWAIWQNHNFRKEDRKRESCARSANELRRWTEEALRLFYLPQNKKNKTIISQGLTDLIAIGVPMTAASIIIGPEFEGLTRRAIAALISYHSALDTPKMKKEVAIEFGTAFSSLELYLNLLSTWDFKYKVFLRELRREKSVEFPLSEHLENIEID
jgi:hypothetical protein